MYRTLPLAGAVQSTRWRRGCASGTRGADCGRMSLHRAPFRIVFWVVAGCWLGAGPGNGVLRAALACRHAGMDMEMAGGHAGHGAPAPNGGPCFCAQMAGAFDQALAVAMPAPWPLGPVTAAPIGRATHLSQFPLP